MSLTIRALLEWHNPGGTDVVLLTACAFSGCREPFARRFGSWHLCARHHEAVLRGSGRRP